jgi:hypothetical protein
LEKAKTSIKNTLPKPIWQAASRVRYGLKHATLWPQATFHPWRRSSRRHLARYRDLHQGQRCFIIGNGPSLKQTDLMRLKNEFTFGMNRIYLLFPELGFNTSYYVSVNDLVIEQCRQDILPLPVPKFLSWRSHKVFQSSLNTFPLSGNDLIFLHTTYAGPKFAKDVRGRLWEGATVTYIALQLAYFMGFNQVILIGVDHSFSTQGSPNTTITSQGDDPDHFHSAYFGKGFRWQLPDLVTSEKAYTMAKEAYLHDQRQILDATIGGKLTIFPKVDYNTLF